MAGIGMVGFLSLIVLAQVTSTQLEVTNSCPANAPVVLQPSPVSATGGHETVTIISKSPKPITAVILRWTTTDSKGLPLMGTSTVDFSPSGAFFEEGGTTETETDFTVRPGTSLKSVEVTCLAVLYGGSGLWGDGKAPEVAKLRAVRQGIRAERRRLQAVLEKEGVDRLREELNRPVVQ